MNKVYRVWFDPGCGYEICCVLVAAETEARAVELAKDQVRDFPSLLNSQCQVSLFDTSMERASIC